MIDARTLLLLILVAGFSSCSPSEERHETYLIVDADAPMEGVDGLPGAVFAYDRTANSLARFSADSRFVDPQMAVFEPDGKILLSDSSATPSGTRGGTGALFRIDGRSGQVLGLFTSPLFMAPNALALGPDGTIYVTDRYAQPAGCEGRGVVFAVDGNFERCEVAMTDARFAAPAFVVWEPEGSLLLLDADTPTGTPGDEGVFFRSVPGSGEVKDVGHLAGTISPLGFLREPEGSLLVFDANADPHRLGGPLGAIFRFLPETGVTTLLLSRQPLRDPVRGCLADDGKVLFVDANSDPLKRGPDVAGRGQNITGCGALFSFDRRTSELELLLSPEEFVNPVSITRRP
ncbi:MAG: hypothetical protein V2A76_05410 [Planctomycetota bacterium]